MFDISDPINLRILDSVTINEDFCKCRRELQVCICRYRTWTGRICDRDLAKTNYNRYMLFQWDGTSFVKKISLKKTQQKMDTWTGAEQMGDFLRVTVLCASCGTG